MGKFPVDAPQARVRRALEKLGVQLVRKGTHVAMRRANPDGSSTPLTLPNHAQIKGSTLRTICTQADIPRKDFLEAYEGS